MGIFSNQSYITEEIQQNSFTPSLHFRRYYKPILKTSNENYTVEYVQAMINDFETSDNRLYMNVAEQYYHSRNDILDQKRFVIGRSSDNTPATIESHILSNNHLVHNFLRKLTHQKISYLLSKPFSFQPNSQDIEACGEMFKELNHYYNLPFYNTLKMACRDAIVDGIGWIYVYYDDNGTLQFKHIPAHEVIPEWVDDDHKDLKSVIRKYRVKEFTGTGFNMVTYVDHYTNMGVTKYRYGGFESSSSSLELLSENEPYFNIKVNENEIGAKWTDIPFIPFKYDSDEYSLLRRIKSLVDDYDKKTSDIANNIDDIPNSVTVIQNYDGASKEEFVHNKNQYRTIFVQGDGGASTLETPLNISEIDKHLSRLREDIYSFGQGVNTTDKDIRDTSGVALRFLYGDLDMDCGDWAEELEWSIYLINWFMLKDILLRTGNDYSNLNYSVVFNVSMILNQSEIINNIVQSKNIISDKTLLTNHPWVLDAEEELKMISEDTERDLIQLQAEEDIQNMYASEEADATEEVTDEESVGQ